MTMPATTSRNAQPAALLRLLRYARGYRSRIGLATLCSILNKLFDIAPEILIGVAIDVVVSQEQSFIARLGVSDPIQQIYLLGVLTFFIWAGESLFEYLYLILWRNLAQSLQHDLRIDAYAHVQNLDMAYFEDRSTGNLVSILNDDINQLERFLNGGANSLIQVATTIVAVGGVFFLLSPLIALLAFTPIPVIVLGAFYFQRRAQPLYAAVRDKVGDLGSRLSNNLSGIATIKSFTAEQTELERLRADSAAYCQANARAIAVSSAFIPVIRMAILTGFLFTFVVGGVMALGGSLAVGSYGVLVFLTQRLLWPLTGLAETVDLYERAMASTRRVLNLLETPISIRNHHAAQPLQRVRGHIVFDRVSFAYGNGLTVLNGVSLEVLPGQTVAFVGQTGSGKSTLMKLLLRFYAPSGGRILLDGLPLERIDLTDLRASIGLVSQDVFLFHGTVRDNIAYGNPAASAVDIVEAAKAAEAHEFIMRLPQGYDTVIGERGQKLSGGQRQRLSIARAVLKDPPILVLDEATSAVDNETEAAIQRSLAKIAVGRTVLMIAHRLSTIVHADRIYVLDEGEIKERGTHHELIARDGLYAALWKVQTGMGQTALKALTSAPA
ncbi:MAG TPA: ABC transporter ATP-binding protein [Candidatus Competibacteraceae bacterium]|nr:ABC transporter ATP-binding protein [Candidatus Competibacteraceae bacterium]